MKKKKFLPLIKLHIFRCNQYSVHALVNLFVSLSHKLQMDEVTIRLNALDDRAI